MSAAASASGIVTSVRIVLRIAVPLVRLFMASHPGFRGSDDYIGQAVEGSHAQRVDGDAARRLDLFIQDDAQTRKRDRLIRSGADGHRHAADAEPLDARKT